MTRLFAASLAFWLIWAGAALPQTVTPLPDGTETATATQPDLIGPPAPQNVPAALPGAFKQPDYNAWGQVAARAEALTGSGRVSIFSLERLRADLVAWRDRFLEAQGINTRRIATVTRQITSLGDVPEAGAEDERITARRAELDAQLSRLRAPIVLATEAYTRADGLIGEIDRNLRDRQAEKLTARGISPLSPAVLGAAATAVAEGTKSLWAETRASLRSTARRSEFWANATVVALYAALALVLLLRGQTYVIRLQHQVTPKSQSGQSVWDFVMSTLQVVVPMLGIYALSEAVVATSIPGYRGRTLIAALPEAAFYILLARWLSARFLGDVAGQGVLALTPEDQLRGRRRLTALARVLAMGALWLAFTRRIEMSDPARMALALPFEILIGAMLFRLGHFLISSSRRGAADGAGASNRARIIRTLGRVLLLVSVGSPLMSAAGYTAASEMILYPSVLTLALLAVVVLLQRLVQDLYAVVTRARDGGRDALAPVLVGFVLLLAVMPVLALIWGARQSDLLEIWTRFREGFAIGQSRISPTDFLTFIVVFVLGYMLTRLIQSTLRHSVLPKTRLDIGAQNAMISGLGYLGVFLSAIAAITTAGIDLSNLAIVAGALSVGIGFGLQNIVSNFVSGIILLIERPISEGDWIEVGGQMGYVRDISVRSTRIETFDRTDVIIPNADLVSGQVTNWTRGNSVGRLIVPIGVAYGTDTAVVMKILREIAEANPMVILTPPPSVVFVAFGADSLNFEIRAMLRDVNFLMPVRSEINLEIDRRFREAGIEIPFAQRDVWLRNPEALRPPPPEEKA